MRTGPQVWEWHSPGPKPPLCWTQACPSSCLLGIVVPDFTFPELIPAAAALPSMCWERTRFGDTGKSEGKGFIKAGKAGNGSCLRPQRATRCRGEKRKLIGLLGTGQMLCQLLKPGSPVSSVCLNPHGRLTKPLPPQDSGEPESSGRSEIMVWELPKGKEKSCGQAAKELYPAAAVLPGSPR